MLELEDPLRGVLFNALSNMNLEEKLKIIKPLLEELTKELGGEIHYYWSCDKYTTSKKIEIIYDRQKR